MGSSSTKPSSSYSQTLAPPSEPATLQTTSPQQPVQCPLVKEQEPSVRHAEWDECVRQSALTLGTTTVAAIAVGLIVPAADTLLLLGTGAGVLWSVKRCRTLMRDGLLSPEEARALEHHRKAEREEKRRQRKMEKEARQRAAAERKQEKIGATSKKSSSTECCEKVKKKLKQKGVNVDDFSCDNVSHENEGSRINTETTLAMAHPDGKKPEENPPVNLSSTIDENDNTDEKEEPLENLKNIPQTANPRTKPSRKRRHPKKLGKHASNSIQLFNGVNYSTVKLFAPYARYLSESVILTCDRKECTCNSNKNDADCSCEPSEQLYEEPRPYVLGIDAEEETRLEEDPRTIEVQQISSVVEDPMEQDGKPEIPTQSVGDGKSPVNDHDDEHPTKEYDLAPVYEIEEDEVEVTLSPTFNSLDSLNEDNGVDLILEAADEVDIKIEDSQDSLDVEVLTHDTSHDRNDQTKNEVEVVFADIYKSESWPFSFSLPPLDKFSKKKNNSFKWPPLTSSIILKPKREHTCKCFGGKETKGNDDKNKECTCSSSKK